MTVSYFRIYCHINVKLWKVAEGKKFIILTRFRRCLKITRIINSSLLVYLVTSQFGDENFKIVVETWILFSYGNFHRRFRIWAQNWQKVCNLTRERHFGHLSDESSQKCQKWTKWRSRVKLKNKLSILRSCSKSWMKITQWKKFMSRLRLNHLRHFGVFDPVGFSANFEFSRLIFSKSRFFLFLLLF